MKEKNETVPGKVIYHIPNLLTFGGKVTVLLKQGKLLLVYKITGLLPY